MFQLLNSAAVSTKFGHRKYVNKRAGLHFNKILLCNTGERPGLPTPGLKNQVSFENLCKHDKTMGNEVS